MKTSICSPLISFSELRTIAPASGRFGCRLQREILRRLGLGKYCWIRRAVPEIFFFWVCPFLFAAQRALQPAIFNAVEFPCACITDFSSTCSAMRGWTSLSVTVFGMGWTRRSNRNWWPRAFPPAFPSSCSCTPGYYVDSVWSRAEREQFRILIPVLWSGTRVCGPSVCSSPSCPSACCWCDP